jgi:probable F420-dependent oxidoreductase
VRFGIHLPQYGHAAGPRAITNAAVLAEQLGFADLWVSDHVAHPAERDYPSPYLYDPLLTLGWAAAATTDIGIGTSVLVLPQHNPLWLAKALASLDALSGGRLTLAVGVGWSAAEFAALGQSFHDRGQRTDEIIDLLRACWTQDPVTFAGRYYQLDRVRVLPQPVHDIRIWVGGSGEAAYRRAHRSGVGFQAIGLDPQQAAAVVTRIRTDEPAPAFTISLRTGWDPQGMDPGRIRAERVAYEAAGIQHVVAAPWRTDEASWLRSMALLAELLDLRAGS